VPKYPPDNFGTGFREPQIRDVRVQIVPGATLSEKEIIEILKTLEGLKRRLQSLLK